MKNLLHSLFGGNDPQVKKDPEREVHTAIAALLIEMANADQDFSDKDRALIARLLKNKFSLQSDEVEKVIVRAEKELNRRIDMYYFTKRINDYFDKPRRIEIMEALWRVIYSDGQLEGHEDLLAHRLANLLHLDHKDMIDAKLKTKAKIDSDMRKD